MLSKEEILNRKYITPSDLKLMKIISPLDVEHNENIDYVMKSDKVILLFNASHPKVRRTEVKILKKCREIGRLCYVIERGSLPATTIIDKNGMLADSISYEEQFWNKKLSEDENKKAEEYINSFVNDQSTLEIQNSERISKKDFLKKLGIKEGQYKKIIFLPLQKADDTTILLWSDWLVHEQHFVDLMSAFAKKHPDYLFLLKPHPRSKTDRQKVFYEDGKNFKTVLNIHYKDLIAYSDKLFVINSGVGLQAMMWGKPTYIFGKSHYQFEGINKKINNQKDMTQALEDEYTVDKEKVLRYIHYLKFVLWTDSDWHQPNGNGIIRMN